MAEQNDRETMRLRMKRRLVAQRARSGYRFRDPVAVSERYAKKRNTTQPVNRPAPFMQATQTEQPTATQPAAPAQPKGLIGMSRLR